MGIDCSQLGKALIIRRDGTRKLLSLEETIQLCNESLNSGKAFHEILKRTEPNLKVIRFIQDGNDEDNTE
ncbi:hypothetical protein [Cuniculiplasma divulgatum]|uniref:Uncharacterized protein n=1 Tax=Cuniculiplasma divulgatum TaxID=1673428 RepID=A0A1N5VC54_9ARCH|nr:hypothetical protein [Cuniculiplasma divulgatum]SIM69847.1 hypothetical protein CSP5_1298 [Cuniculiplasma divulgatum]